MDFKKKLRTRLYVAISYVVLGVMMIAGTAITKSEHYFFSSFGIALVVVGIARMKQYFLITKSEESIRKREIVETDERNVSIIHMAKSAAFNTYVLLCGMVGIVLHALDKSEIANAIWYSVLVLVFIYWICYFIYQKKSFVNIT